MTPRPTASSFAVLGLLALQTWPAYELVAQSKRSLHWFWPRSERHLYAELKRLVERGHAEAHVEGGLRQRTRYTITPAGRAALQEWLHTEPAPPTLEIEGLLRVMLGDQGTVDDLRAALETTARQARKLRAEGIPILADLLVTGGPFPQRLHLTERLVSFHADFNNLLIRWCEETLAEVETWQGTQDIGLTPRGRQRLARAITEEP
jgi:PadR family transcriptional regulator AphA